MVEVTLPIILQLVQTVSLVIGIIYYLTIMKNTSKARQTEILFQRHKVDLDYVRSWADVMFIQDWDTFEELEEKYPWDTHFEERTRVIYILNTYNNLGLILREKVVDPKLVFELYSVPNIITTWKKYENFLNTIRQKSNNSEQYDAFDYLYNEARKIYPQVSTIPSARVKNSNT